jgi:NDMA-dependent alcohol dehydrogenase
MPKAAVLVERNQPLELHDLEQDGPQAGEVLVRIAASGICHTDASVYDGTIPLEMPIVLGHEASGIVEAVGADVSSVRPGDHVVVSLAVSCGGCAPCTRGQPFLCEVAIQHQMEGSLLDGTKRLHLGGSPVSQFAFVGSFSETVVVPEAATVGIPDDVSLTSAALIGCGVLTGVGAATKTATIRAGDTVVVVGTGGVGLNAIQGARLAGAERIIAVDLVDWKLDLAMQFGATDSVNASTTDVVAAVMELTGRGADVGIEVVGSADTLMTTASMTRRGGEVVIVGVPAFDVMYPVPVFGMIYSAQRVVGSVLGSADLRADVPHLIELYQRGELLLDELVTRTIRLDQVNDGFAALSTGDVARTVIEF